MYQKEIFNKTWKNRIVRIFWNKNIPNCPRQFKIFNNGGRKKNGDKCFSFWHSELHKPEKKIKEIKEND